MRKCVSYAKLQTHKDTEHYIMFAEAVGDDDPSHAENVIGVHSVTPPTSDDKWCYMQHVLLLQEDFWTEKPLIQMLIEDTGHLCLFLL